MAMNNSLAEVHPELVSEWSEKNLTLTPDDITFGSNKKVWWRGACGHEWQASVKARSNGEKMSDMFRCESDCTEEQFSRSGTIYRRSKTKVLPFRSEDRGRGLTTAAAPFYVIFGVRSGTIDYNEKNVCPAGKQTKKSRHPGIIHIF